MNKVLSIRQVANILGLHPNTIRAYIRKALLPAHKLGGNGKSRRHWRVKVTDLDNFMQGAGSAHGRHTKKESDSSEQVAGSAPNKRR